MRKGSKHSRLIPINTTYLRKIMAVRNLTQTELAEEINYTQASISNVFKRGTASAAFCVLIGARFNVNMCDLVNMSEWSEIK